MGHADQPDAFGFIGVIPVLAGARVSPEAQPREWAASANSSSEGLGNNSGVRRSGVALYLNRRLWSFTAPNSWIGNLSPDFNSWPELHLNRRPLRSSGRQRALGGDLPQQTSQPPKSRLPAEISCSGNKGETRARLKWNHYCILNMDYLG